MILYLFCSKLRGDCTEYLFGIPLPTKIGLCCKYWLNNYGRYLCSSELLWCFCGFVSVFVIEVVFHLCYHGTNFVFALVSSLVNFFWLRLLPTTTFLTTWLSKHFLLTITQTTTTTTTTTTKTTTILSTILLLKKSMKTWLWKCFLLTITQHKHQ